MIGRSRRLVVLGSHPIPYRVPLYRRLAARADLELCVLYGDDYGVRPRDSDWGVSDFVWDGDLLEGYPCQVLRNLSLRPHPSTFWGKVNPGLISAVRAFRPDAALVMGYSRLYNLLGWWGALRAKARVLYTSDTNHLTEPVGLKRRLKHTVLERLYRKVDRFLVTGARNSEHYLAYRVPAAKLVSFPWAIDNDHWRGRAATLMPSRGEIRRRWGIAEHATCVLFSGRLSVEKGVADLLRAAAAVSEVHVLVAGDGPERARLGALAAATVPRRHTFAGFLNQTALPEAYAAADLLALPSWYEPWGLVCHEAMCFGLPLLLSDRVGAGADLVRDGRTGWSFRARDLGSLETALKAAVRAVREDVEALRQEVTATIDDYDIAHQEEGLMHALA